MSLNSTDLSSVQFKELDQIIRGLLSVHKNPLRLILSDRMPSRIEFTDEQIEEMGEEYGKGTPLTKLAEDHGVSRSPIRRVLLENGYKSTDKENSAKENIDEMVKLYCAGFPAGYIGDKFGVNKKTVLRWIREKGQTIKPAAHLRDNTSFERGNKPPSYVEREVPEPWDNADAAYVFGVLIGDASLQYRYYLGEKRNPKGISLDTPDKEFKSEFSRAIKLAFEIQPVEHPGRKKNSIMIEAYSVDFARSYDRFKWRKETWRIPEQFFDTPREIRTALCQGKFDSDGGVDGRSITTTSIHKNGLLDLQEIVEGLGFETTFRGPFSPHGWGKREQYVLRVLDVSCNLFRLSRKRRVLQRTDS